METTRMDRNDTVLIEAEQFTTLGGWVIDQQFMDSMGSPFLLAHGLGRPVADALTRISLPAAGTYKVWVRTRNWVAPWHGTGMTKLTPADAADPAAAPGRFQLVINGTPCSAVFGTEGAAWHWQAGNVLSLPAGDITLALHDLTGFEARCDAVILTLALQDCPPNSPSDLELFRQHLLPETVAYRSAGEFDLVVVGGGIAGMCTAMAAGRLGLSVALLQDRPVVGGNNSSEIRVWLGGKTNLKPYPHIGDVVKQIEPKKRAHHGPKNTGEIYEDAHKATLLQKAHVRVFYNYHVNGIETAGDNKSTGDNQTRGNNTPAGDARTADPSKIITAVRAQNIRDGTKIAVRGQWFADCSGDAVLGYLAGADHEMTTTGHMGQCNLWHLKETRHPVTFPRCPWAFNLTDHPFPGRDAKFDHIMKKKELQKVVNRFGAWYWEAGFYRDPIADDEFNRDTNFMAMYGAVDALKNAETVFANWELHWAAYISGRRESRRLLGDVIVDLPMLLNQTQFPDGCVPTGWSVDLHLPKKPYNAGFAGSEFISEALNTKYPRPFWIPYRALYSRNITNLFMAGRNISVTHEGLGAVRVMRTGGMMGEVVGMAASLCKKYHTTPRGVFDQHWPELQALIRKGVKK